FLQAEDGIRDRTVTGVQTCALPISILREDGIPEILEEFQKLGYPVFAQDCLPIDDDMIWRLFGEDVLAGETPDPLCINDVWKNRSEERRVGKERRKQSTTYDHHNTI